MLEAYDLVARFRRHDGQWRWLRAVSMLRQDAEGHVIGMVGAASDITEAKEAELELQRQVAERTAELSETQEQRRQAHHQTSIPVAVTATSRAVTTPAPPAVVQQR